MIDVSELAAARTIVVIGGPTASGKTGAAVALAERMNIEVLSADSRQVFKYLDFGTAKPTAEEQSAVKHHFVDFLEPDEYYSAGLFADQAEEKANELLESGIIPIVVGGSGLYIKGLCEGFFEENLDEKENNRIRDELHKRLENKGIECLISELEIYDLKSVELYSDKNPRRIIRAMEYYQTTGTALSEAQEKHAKQKNFRVLNFAVDVERSKLYEKINLRADIMWESGLIEETEKVLNMGFSSDLNSLNTVGYKECIAFLKGDMSKEEAIEIMKRNTRRYAKRQMTWFRKVPNIKWLSGNSDFIADQIIKSL